MHTTKGEMNYHAAVRGHRQLPDHGGGHSGGPTHSQPSRVATSRRLYATHPHTANKPGFHISRTRGKLPSLAPTQKNNNTHATQSKAKHSKKRTVEHLCSSTYRDWVSWLVLNSNHAYASVCRGTHAQCDTYQCDTYHTGLHSASLRRTGG